MAEFIGFIAEHDLISESRTFQEYQAHPKSAPDWIDQVTSHLEKGVLLFGWMGYVYDLIDQAPIAPHAYYTDGVLIWPSYLKHYLLKYSAFSLNKAVIRRMYRQMGQPITINSEQLSELENILGDKLNNAW